MICRHRRACIDGSPFPTVPPSGPSGAVPETVTTLPARTAREMPTFGSYGLPLETSLRMIQRAYKIHDLEAKMSSTASRHASIGIAAAVLVFGFSTTVHAQQYVKGERPQQRGYSLAVITEGGKTVWLGGQIATVDDTGKSLAGDFEGQVRQIFKLIDATLQKAGGKLSNMVQMTVFITDVRYGDRLTEIRREIFGDNFPGSALSTITALANPDAKVEIQGYAVIGSK